VASRQWVEARAAALLAAHSLHDWSFAWDNAKTRFGQCSHRYRRITLSRYLSDAGSEDESEQVLLHEIAHALAGVRSGHGDKWLRIARSIGYRGQRTHTSPAATEHAKWRGVCPSGHEIIRFRRPSRPMSCAKCERRFNPTHLIVWTERTYASTVTSFQNAT
jgi:SprT protein